MMCFYPGWYLKQHPAVLYLYIVSSVKYTRLSKKSCTKCPPLVQQVYNWVNILIKKANYMKTLIIIIIIGPGYNRKDVVDRHNVSPDATPWVTNIVLKANFCNQGARMSLQCNLICDVKTFLNKGQGSTSS